MNEMVHFIGTLFWKVLYLPWINLPFLYQTLVIGFLVVYLYATFRYKRLAREASETINLAPISVKGGISKALGAREAGLILRTQISAIAETFRKSTRDHASVYAAEAVGVDFPIVNAALVDAASEFSPSELRLKEELAVKMGPVEIPVGVVVRLLEALLRVLPVPYRRRYWASLVHVSLVSIDRETQLLVYRRGQPPVSLRRSQVQGTGQTGNGPGVLARAAAAENLTDFTDVLRDAAFMILQHHGSFEGRNWLGMRCFADGLDALERYRQTAKDEFMDRAKKGFARAVAADEDNSEAHYFYGSIVLLDRTRESIATAMRLFTRALKTLEKTDNSKLKAFVHSGLAFCYAQQWHRLSQREAGVLRKARDHAEQSLQYWGKATRREQADSTRSDRPPPFILSTRAMVDIVDEGTIDLGEDPKTRFLTAARLLLQAIEMEPDNGMSHNVLGWLLLKLAERVERGVDELRPEDGIPPELSGHPAQTAEYYLRRALDLNSANKLNHANLCLLYATRWYREKERKKYLTRCRSHGLMALSLDPTYINGHRDLALSLLRYEEFKDAYEYFQRALQLSPTIEKAEEIIRDAVTVLEEMKVSEQELERWRYPDRRLLEPPDERL